MRIIGVVLGLGILWAQEESRIRGATPTSARPTRSAVSPQPARPQAAEEVVIMETVSGKVVDKAGKQVSGLRLWFVDKESGRVLGETRTDDKGNFAVAISRAETLIVRMSREGKEFVEREYSMEELLQTEPEIPFEP